jgi:phospholipid/cholesterol/gamma-HCH transport system permease protein
VSVTTGQPGQTGAPDRPPSLQRQLEAGRASRRMPAVPDPFGGLGAYAEFTWRGMREIRRLGPYASEVLRQAAIIASGSTLVIIFTTFLVGNACGLEASAAGRALGAGIIAPFFSAICTTREVVPFIFGYILAAKVGCGMVAEIGSMRVREEVDALDVMGVPSISYLVSSRILASIVVLPLIYIVAVATGQFGAWLASLVRFGDISQGSWEFAFYIALDPIDLVYTLLKGLGITFFVISVALYYGYGVRGGPVEVGVATARSMGVNLIVVTVVNTVGTFIFWGLNPGLPIA